MVGSLRTSTPPAAASAATAARKGEGALPGLSLPAKNRQAHK